MVKKNIIPQVIAIMLLTVVLYQNLNKIYRVAEFHINRSYYAENECKFRFSPDVICNAQCVLDVILDLDDETSGSSFEVPKNIHYDKYFNELELRDRDRDVYKTSSISTSIDNNYSFIFISSILQPPQV